MRFAYQLEMFIDGSSYVRKVEADCVSERESRDVSVYSPHQDLLPPRVTVFEVAKRCSRYFQRHLTSYDIRRLRDPWAHSRTSGMINVCLGQRTNK